MAVLLRIILVMLAAVAVALAIPRIAGEEYYLSVRWKRTVTSDEVTRVPAGSVTADGVFVTGTETIAVLSGETGELLFGSVRQPVFSVSGDFLINQSEEAGERWAVTNRRTGSSQFFDRLGIPRLYGPVLAQFQRTAVILKHVRYPGVVTLPNQGEITVLDIAPRTSPDESEYLVVVGDVYGTVTLVTVDFSSGTTETVALPRLTAENEDRVTVVYGVQISGSFPDPGLIVLRGRNPQYLEYFNLGDLDNPARHVVPTTNEIVQPPTISALPAGQYAIGVRDAILLLSTPDGELQQVGYAGDAHVAGPIAATALVLITSSRDNVHVGIHESVGEEQATVPWTFPGARISALDSDLLVVERDNHFIALEVQR